MSEPRFKNDIKMSDKITVEMPAYVWLAFVATYGNSEWSCQYTNMIQRAALQAMLDPIYIKEQEAAAQEAQDQAHASWHQMFTGHPPEVPPHMENPE